MYIVKHFASEKRAKIIFFVPKGLSGLSLFPVRIVIYIYMYYISLSYYFFNKCLSLRSGVLESLLCVIKYCE